MSNIETKELLELLKNLKTRLLQEEVTNFSSKLDTVSKPEASKGTTASTTTTAADALTCSLVIPSSTYRPQIQVAIDFTAKFTVDVKDAQGDRLVSDDKLLAAAIKLANFWSFYFNDAFLATDLSESLTRISDKKYQQESRTTGTQTKVSEFFIKTLEQLKHKNIETANTFLNKIINLFIVGIQTNRQLNDVGTCSISFRDNFTQIAQQTGNTHAGRTSTLFFDTASTILNQIFSPMLPITVWAKGRIYKDKWFPLFTGFISQMEPTCREGFTELTIYCRDSLELARISTEMINPALIMYEQFKEQTALQLNSMPFYNQSITQIVKLMFYGGSIAETATDTKDKLKNLENAIITSRQEILRKDHNKIVSEGSLLFQALGNYIIYSSLTNDKPDITNARVPIDQTLFTNVDFLIKKLRNPTQVIIWGPEITPYNVFGIVSPQSFTSQFMSRFECLKAAAKYTYFNFYADAYGNVQFHPMRFADKFFIYEAIWKDDKGEDIKIPKKNINAFIISPHETTQMTTLFDIQNLVTFKRIGATDPTIPSNTEENKALIGDMGSAADIILMKKYGFRMSNNLDEVINYNFKVGDSNGHPVSFLDLFAREKLKFENGELYTRTATIIFRPELELANPVFFTDINHIFYIQSISHSINIGQNATTTINCNFGRSEIEDPSMILDFLIQNQKLLNNKAKLESNDKQKFIDFLQNQTNRYVYSIKDIERQQQKQAEAAQKDPGPDQSNKASNKKNKKKIT